jgi:UDP-glucose 4-epimerase
LETGVLRAAMKSSEKKMSTQPLCLVTGGAGFIGSHLAERLVHEGYRVRVFDNFSAGRKENMKEVLSQIEVLRGDLRNDSDVNRAVRDVDYVFHAAAMRSILRSVENPFEVHEVNGSGTLRLLMACRQAKIKRFIFSSSSSVYGGTKHFPMRETDLLSPQSPYASSKILGEYYCRLFWTLYGLDTVSLRYFNVFGPRQDPRSRYSNAIPLFIARLLKGESIELHWDGKQSRDFCFIENVVKANVLAMKAKNVAGDVFNIGGNEETTLLEMIASIQRLLGVKNIKMIRRPKRVGDFRRTYACVDKARKLLGYSDLVSYHEGLRRTVRWFMEHTESFAK